MSLLRPLAGVLRMAMRRVRRVRLALSAHARPTNRVAPSPRPPASRPAAATALVAATARRGVAFTASPLGWWVVLHAPGGGVAEITSVEAGRYRLATGDAPPRMYPSAEAALEAACGPGPAAPACPTLRGGA